MPQVANHAFETLIVVMSVTVLVILVMVVMVMGVRGHASSLPLLDHFCGPILTDARPKVRWEFRSWGEPPIVEEQIHTTSVTAQMKTTPPTWANTALLAFAGVFLLSSCSDGQLPDSLPFGDNAAAETTDTAALTSSDETPTSTTSADLPSLDPTSSETAEQGSTTTQEPPPPPLEPTLEVECATDPRTVTVTLSDPPDVPIDWELNVRRQPSGVGLDPVVELLFTGTGVPDEAIVHEVVANDLQFIVTSSNASGRAEAVVDVDRYSGCPIGASQQARVVERIDCVSGAFQFTPAPGSNILVDSVVVDRFGGTASTLQLNPSGTYRVPGWSGPDEVKAIVTFWDPDGRHVEHINHWCFGGPFGTELGGAYKVCADEAVMLAYPGEWVSSRDLGGSDCEFFRYGPVSNGADNNVTLNSLGATTLEDATASLLPPGPWIIADQEVLNAAAFSDRIGTVSGGERIRFALAWDNAPTLVRRVVWLVEVEGAVWRLEANIQGLEEIDGMANSLQFLPQ